MGITAIKSISNRHSSEKYLVKNLENPNDTGGPGRALEVNPGQTIQCNMWLPWCTSQSDFDNKHRIVISPVAFNQIPVTFTIWQHGDYVRYAKDGLFRSNGVLVPGNATVNGDRSVEITGTTLFDAEIRFY